MSVSNSVKVRIQVRDNAVTVRMIIRHAMEVGGYRPDGQYVAAHFITELICHHNAEPVLHAYWGPGISKDPYLSFTVRPAKIGDELQVRWIDNQGMSDEFTMRF